MKFDEFKPLVIAALVDCPKKASEIAQATGANSASAYNWLKKLVIAGDIVKGHDGVYRLSTNEELSEAFIETAIAESKAIEVEVIEMRIPSAAMTVEKFTAKDGHIVPKPGLTDSGDTSKKSKSSKSQIQKIVPIKAISKSAAYEFMQEKDAEQRYAGLMFNKNIGEGLSDPSYAGKLGANWKEFIKVYSLEGLGLASVGRVTADFMKAREKKVMGIPPDDIENYVADKIFLQKLLSNAFCDSTYQRLAAQCFSKRLERGEHFETITKIITQILPKRLREEFQEADPPLLEFLIEKSQEIVGDFLKKIIDKILDENYDAICEEFRKDIKLFGEGK